MSDTDPNAYRTEASEKRALITQLAAEANDLDAKADQLEGKGVETPPAEAEATTEPAADQKDKKLFGKK